MAHRDDLAVLGLDMPEGEGVSAGETWFHRVGWALFGTIILAALAGLLGPGPLSSRTACVARSFCIDYERFVRNHAPAELRIRILKRGDRDSVRLALGREFLDATQQESITPEPDHVELLPGGQLHLIRAPRLGPNETLIVYRYQTDGPFRDLTIRVSAGDEPGLDVRQFVYP